MSRQLVVLIIILVLWVAPLADVPGGADGMSRGPMNARADSPWSDTFDDMSKVYLPPGGFVGVEVADGEVRLRTGETEGWIASSVITSPEGMHYDLVLLEAMVPGNSSIKISILDATEESSVIGFANDTIPGYVKVEDTDLSVFKLNQSMYPKIRIQVDLVANGTDRPVLKAWSLYYVPFGEWRDEFLGTAKMDDQRGLNITGGTVGINLTEGKLVGGAGKYRAYPTVFIATGGPLRAFYADSGGTGYQDYTNVTAQASASVAFDDLNGDGYLDLVYSNHLNSDSQIYWGDENGTWSSEGATDLGTQNTFHVNTGDFNGDGEIDIAFAGNGGGNTGKVFMNQGGGDFNHTCDLDLGAVWRIACGDFNADGFTDLATDGIDIIYIFYGSSDGLPSTPDVTFSGQEVPYAEDVDGDGYADLLTGGMTFGGMYVRLGGPDGLPTSPDYQLNAGVGYFGRKSNAGDINGDGYVDLVSTIVGGGPDSIYVFEGSESGWDSADRQHIVDGSNCNVVLDVDLDGYEDLLISADGNFQVWFGGDSWPTSASISKPTGISTGYDIAAAVPKFGFTYAGSFMTEEITLPPGKKWDILDLEGTLPENTSVTLSVLNATQIPIDGFSGLKEWNIDLSDLSDHETIHVKVELTSRSNSTAPVLDRLLVKWMDETTWREQFYGEAKIANLTALEVKDDELRRSIEVGGPENGSYLSKAFGPEDLRDADCFQTLRYTARLGTSQSGRIQLIDNATSDVLDEIQLQTGDHEWDLADAFSLSKHPSIQVRINAEGLDEAGEFALDDLRLNWTVRIRRAPEVLDLRLSTSSVHRTEPVQLYVTVSDEYDSLEDLEVKVQHRLNDTSKWRKYLVESEELTMGCWTFDVTPRTDDPIGVYRFRVNVTDLDGNHSGFIEFPNTLEVLPNLPSVPMHLTATASDGEVELEWEIPESWGDELLNGHRVLRGLESDALEPLATVEFFTISYIDTDVTNGVTYHYAVVAFISVGEGPMSEVVQATPRGPPRSPRHLMAEAGDQQVKLSWEPPTDDGGSAVLGYHIFRGPNEFYLEWSHDVEGTSFLDTGLENGVPLFYSVRAYNLIDNGTWSAIVQATPLALPKAPIDINAEAGNGSVRVYWRAPLDSGGLDVIQYIVYRGTSKDDLERLTEVDAMTCAYLDEDIIGGIEYLYAVTAVTGMGEGPRSVTVSAMPYGKPSVPIGLSAKIADGGVELSWSPPASDGFRPIIGFVLVYGPTINNLSHSLQLGDVTSCIIQGAHGGRTYYYAVAARNEIGRGDFTAPVPVTLPAPPKEPSKVLDIQGIVKGSTVTIVWLPPEDNGGTPILGYTLMRGRDPNDLQVLVELGVVLSYVDEVSEEGRTYYYRVVARNAVGQGEASDDIKVDVPTVRKGDEPGFEIMTMTLAMIIATLVTIYSRRGRRAEGGW